MISRIWEELFQADPQQSAFQLGLFLFLFFTGWIIENYSFGESRQIKWRHAFLNIKIFLVDLLPQVWLGWFFINIMHWTAHREFGLIYFLSFDHLYLLKFLCVFMFLDLGEYLYHVIMHKVKCFWMIHAIHHSDMQVDVSTVFREHPFETVIRNLFALFFVSVSGVTPWIFFIHLVVQKFFVLFSHTHIWLPEKLNKIMSLLFITPNLHQVHHHYKQPYTDSNYGDILSIWDRLDIPEQSIPLIPD